MAKHIRVRDYQPHDVVTADERRMIDEAIAAGRVQVIPRGVESDQQDGRSAKRQAMYRLRGTAASRRKHAVSYQTYLLKRRMALQAAETGAT